MTPIHLTPSARLRSKYRFQLWLGLAISLLWTIPLALLMGFDVDGAMGATVGLVVVLTGNALWFLPTYWLVDRYFESLHYEIQEDEVIVRVGIWTQSVKHVPYRTVTNIAIKRDPLDRFLFHIGTVEIQTAGGSSTQGNAEETLVGLTDYEGVYGIVSDALRRYRTQPLAPTQSTGEPPAPLNREGLGPALLAELQAIRALLEGQREA